eukprot:Lithocolla_globosa_v1_NODE_1114_length_2859_cov_12.203281.p1 type:complete len:289 gc:universal NODE_1114_length_2859_cov_12.203281:1439-2305(+)
MKGYPSIGKGRKKMKWLLVVVDVFSRKLYAEAMPNKEVITVVAAFKDVIKRMGYPPENLDTDNGSEFLKTFDSKIPESITHWKAPVGDHKALGIVDRTVGLFKTLLFRSITEQDEEGEPITWAKNLQDFVENYNTTPKEPLFGYSPDEIENDSKLQDLIRVKNQDNMIRMNKSKKKKAPFEVGDTVRIPAQSGPFKRSFKKQQTDKTYTITKVNATTVIVEVNKKPKRFLFSEVNKAGIPLDSKTFEVEEVTDRTRKIKRGKKNITQCWVKFKGYDEPEWVDETDLIQ